MGFGEKSIMCEAKNSSIDMHRYHQKQLMGFEEKATMCDAKSSSIDMHRYHQEQLMGFGEKSIMWHFSISARETGLEPMTQKATGMAEKTATLAKATATPEVLRNFARPLPKRSREAQPKFQI